MLIAFHLGRVYTLSLAELLAVFEEKKVPFTIKELYTEVLVIETPAVLDLASLQKRLGGTIKIMEVVDILPYKSKEEQLANILQNYFHPNILKSHYFKQSSGKIQFGLSLYPLAEKLRLFGQNKRLGMEIKKRLQKDSISCRLVLPEGASLALPSVVVTNNFLLEKGCEIDLLISKNNIYTARTVSVQDFVDYGRRDYQRPARDARVGMIPPKVAQIMINLARIPETIKATESFLLDPFCGSGTIMTEAMIMGYRVLGSDISAQAVDAAEKNLNWIRTRYKLPPGRFEVFVSDVKKLNQEINNRQVHTIVTEGTLGPAYQTPPSETEIKKNFENLGKIYLNAFAEFKKLLKPGSKIVIALPAYRKPDGYISFPIVDKILQSGYDIVALIEQKLLSNFPFLKVTPRQSIIYERKDQIVVREIIVFQLKS
jgi:tRNA (guanine10-N2)-dimethyltransferase